MKKKEVGDGLTTVRGIVIPVEWNESGNALAAIISSSGEREYLVKQDPKGRQLLELIRQEVEVVGVVRRTGKGHRTITVRSHELIRSADY